MVVSSPTRSTASRSCFPRIDDAQPRTTDLMRNVNCLQAACIVVLLALAPATATAQARSAKSGEVSAALSAVREADIRRDIGEMASPGMRGREGGTIDEMRASAWVAEQYRRIGLKPRGDDSTYYQWFDMTRTRVSVTASSASIDGRAMALFEDMIPTAVAPVTVSGPVLW